MNLQARPGQVRSDPPAAGTTAVALTNGRQGVLHVPLGEITGLVVALHGAGGRPADALALFAGPADRFGLIVLAPASAGPTWAMIRGGPDPDTAAIDAALATVFQRQSLPPAAVAVAGFSDGASYALSLGLANGDLFTKVVAFSPGFQAADRRRGQPSFLVTHGTRDPVLPIDRTSRRVVRALRREGYGVRYVEFDGGHVVPPEYAADAAEWIRGSPG